MALTANDTGTRLASVSDPTYTNIEFIPTRDAFNILPNIIKLTKLMVHHKMSPASILTKINC